MANCKNHPQMAATGRCAGCAEEFCGNCLVEIQGQQFCGSCKVMALQGRMPTAAEAVQEARTMPNKLAKDALIAAIVGIFCFGIILEPYAIYKAAQAKKAIAADPRLGGQGMSTAAMTIGVIGLILWFIGIVARVSAIK